MSLRSGLIGKKLCMTQVYMPNGVVIPVTLINVDKNFVLSIKKLRDDLKAIQVASFPQKAQRVNKSVLGVFRKANVEPCKKIKQFVVDDLFSPKVGDIFDVSYFKKGQYVDVTGCSIGKGYAGPMKRHNFGGLEASHGVSVNHRSHGSTGQCQDPGKVFKGKKMAGRMGGKKVTKQNIEVIDVDLELGILALKGSVPGFSNSYLFIKDAKKKLSLLGSYV